MSTVGVVDAYVLNAHCQSSLDMNIPCPSNELHVGIKELSNSIGNILNVYIQSIHDCSQMRKGKMENTSIFIQLQFKLKSNPTDQSKIALDRSREKKEFKQPDRILSATRNVKTIGLWIVLHFQERKAPFSLINPPLWFIYLVNKLVSIEQAGSTPSSQTFFFEVLFAPSYWNTLLFERLNLIHL